MPYQDFPDWQEVVKDKHLIFDTDAIISLIAFEAEEVFGKLKKLGATLNFVNPVLLELMSTESSKEKLKRNSVLSYYGFNELPLTITELKNASRIQQSLPLGIKGNPSAADFYIGGALVHYSHAYLLTSNIKDFPMPIFTRKAFIPLINKTDFKAICIVGLDSSKLVT